MITTHRIFGPYHGKEAMRPRDEIEAMLAVQIVAAHGLAMETLAERQA
jgi:hypothetical protein